MRWRRTNTLTNRPAVLARHQCNHRDSRSVIARANTPAPSRNVADRIRWVGFGNTSPQEYISYLDPVTYGHNSAAGAIGVAAYPFFAPFVPEAFTSPGPSTIYFDKDSQRLRHVEYRQKPDLAAMDGANTTFFTADTANDDGHVPELLRNQRGGTACRGDCSARAGCRGRARLSQAQEDAGDPAGQRVRARPRSVLLVGLRRCRAATSSRSTRNADPNAISQFDPNVFTVTHFGTSRAREPVDQRNRREPDELAGWHRVRRAGSAVTGTRATISSWVNTEGLTPLDVQATLSLPGGSAGPRGAVEAARPHVPAGNVRER